MPRLPFLNGAIVQIPNAGHEIQECQPKVVAEVIGIFLRRIGY